MAKLFSASQRSAKPWVLEHRELWLRTFNRLPMEVKSVAMVPRDGTAEDACDFLMKAPVLPGVHGYCAKCYNAFRGEDKNLPVPKWPDWRDDLKKGYPVDLYGEYGEKNVTVSYVRYLPVARVDGPVIIFDFFDKRMQPMPECLKKLLVDKSVKRIAFSWRNDCEALNNTVKSLKLCKCHSIIADAQLICEDITICERDQLCDNKAGICTCGIHEMPFDVNDLSTGLKNLAKYFFDVDMQKGWSPRGQNWNTSTETILKHGRRNNQDLEYLMAMDVLIRVDVYLAFDRWYSPLSKFNGLCREAQKSMVKKRGRPFLFRLPKESLWSLARCAAASGENSTATLTRQSHHVPGTILPDIFEPHPIMEIIQRTAKQFKETVGRNWKNDDQLVANIKEHWLYISAKCEIFENSVLMPEEKINYQEMLLKRIVNTIGGRNRSGKGNRRRNKETCRQHRLAKLSLMGGISASDNQSYHP